MSLPDLPDDLTAQQLRDLIDLAATRLAQTQGQEQTTRQQLLDPGVVRGEIESLQGQVTDLHAVIETLTPHQEGDDDGTDADPLVAVAQACCRIAHNTIRLLRTSAGVLDSSDLGEEG